MANGSNMFLGGKIFVGVDQVQSLNTPIDQVIIPGSSNLVVCLTNSSFNATTDSVDVSSQCSGTDKEFLAALNSGTISGTGNSVDLEDSDPDLNQNELMLMWKNRTVAWWFMYSEDFKYVRYAKGFLTSDTEDNPYATQSTFNFTVQLTGEVGIAANPT